MNENVMNENVMKYNEHVLTVQWTWYENAMKMKWKRDEKTNQSDERCIENAMETQWKCNEQGMRMQREWYETKFKCHEIIEIHWKCIEQTLKIQWQFN